MARVQKYLLPETVTEIYLQPALHVLTKLVNPHVFFGFNYVSKQLEVLKQFVLSEYYGFSRWTSSRKFSFPFLWVQLAFLPPIFQSLRGYLKSNRNLNSAFYPKSRPGNLTNSNWFAWRRFSRYQFLTLFKF